MNEYLTVLRKHGFGVATKQLIVYIFVQRNSIFIVNFDGVQHFLTLFNFHSENNFRFSFPFQ